MSRLQAGESGDQEYRLIRPDGSTQWVRETVMAFAEPGKATCLHGTVTEVNGHPTGEPVALHGNKGFHPVMQRVPPSS
jgi:hypothetical protein